VDGKGNGGDKNTYLRRFHAMRGKGDSLVTPKKVIEEGGKRSPQEKM